MTSGLRGTTPGESRKKGLGPFGRIPSNKEPKAPVRAGAFLGLRADPPCRCRSSTLAGCRADGSLDRDNPMGPCSCVVYTWARKGLSISWLQGLLVYYNGPWTLCGQRDVNPRLTGTSSPWENPGAPHGPLREICLTPSRAAIMDAGWSWRPGRPKKQINTCVYGYTYIHIYIYIHDICT